jgi:hypothetical protein
MSKIESKLGREIWSFHALIVMNIVAGAVVGGISMSYGIQYILAIVNALPSIELLYSLPIAALALAIVGVAFTWLVSSAELFDEAQEMKKECQGKDAAETSATSIIVKTMALYRERRGTIIRMAWVSKMAGILLLGIAAYNLISLAAFGLSGNLLLTAISIAMNLAMGAVALYIPHLFSNFSRSWDSRLAQGEKAEEELRKVLEGKA